MELRVGEKPNHRSKNHLITDRRITMHDVKTTGFGGRQVPLIVLLTFLVAIVCTYFVLKRYVSLKELNPVSLNTSGTYVLNQKLQALGFQPNTCQIASTQTGDGLSTANDVEQKQSEELDLEPEACSENPEKREINLTEKELNSMVANNTDLLKRLAIDLSNDLASVKMPIPIQEYFPVLGGKTLRINAGFWFVIFK